ncbi:cation transporting ATPase C-terminal domain-containing protein [Mucilaginibacter litoreus]|uniref:Cation transporting ATPase C-terminal domain-containing protein n=1 Tax=Mucilaginibacter litoreus TaxID=1048221 RepID=A0ABW3AVM8_9SPHI
MPKDNYGIQGLSGQEVLAARAAYGANRLFGKRSKRLIDALIGIAKEPMVVLLIALIYLRPLAIFFKLTALRPGQLIAGLAIGFVSVIWFEALKWWGRKISVRKTKVY